jgi:uncharacterized ferritin-like protein (DUF455 family)
VQNIFNLAERCLYSPDIQTKIELTEAASLLNQKKELDFQSHGFPHRVNQVRFPEHPQWLPPKKMPQRKMTTIEGQAAFFHALAHIEFVAINLAWDMVYRFRDLPQTFYQDWLVVAAEETLHFQMLQQHLQRYHGKQYGDYPAHGGLWHHAEQTAEDVLARLAIIPRCMEARGLDVTPQMIENFKQAGDQESVNLLTRILNDEITHVQKGSYWFKRICQEKNLDEIKTYQYMVETYFIGYPRGPFNRDLRIIAGFSEAEIDWLEEKS